MRPMKASTYGEAPVTFPKIVQPKLDGIRAVIDNNVALSNTLKPLPNQFIQSWVREQGPKFQGIGLQCFDGEITVGHPLFEDCYRSTDSGVMTRHGEPDFTYHVFDMWGDSHMEFHARYDYLGYVARTIGDSRICMVPNLMVNNETQLLHSEEKIVMLGYEGIVLRDPCGTYKYGRSTPRDQKLIKWKRFEDSDAVIIGFEELLSNQNEKTENALGLSERSSHQANMIPMDTLGAFLARDMYSGVEFRVGTFKGLNLEQRREIWHARDAYLGKTFVYKFQKIGGYALPRIPTWKGWRNDV